MIPHGLMERPAPQTADFQEQNPSTLRFLLGSFPSFAARNALEASIAAKGAMSYYHAHKDGNKDKDGLTGEVASLAFSNTVSNDAYVAVQACSRLSGSAWRCWWLAAMPRGCSHAGTRGLMTATCRMG